MKYTILVNLFTTTKISLYFFSYSNFVIKSTVIYIQGFTETALEISIPSSISIQYLFGLYLSHSSTYYFTFLVTSGHQEFWVTTSTIFYYSLYASTNISWYSYIMFALSLLFFEIYIFSSFSILLSTLYILEHSLLPFLFLWLYLTSHYS